MMPIPAATPATTPATIPARNLVTPLVAIFLAAAAGPAWTSVDDDALWTQREQVVATAPMYGGVIADQHGPMLRYTWMGIGWLATLDGERLGQGPGAVSEISERPPPGTLGFGVVNDVLPGAIRGLQHWCSYQSLGADGRAARVFSDDWYWAGGAVTLPASLDASGGVYFSQAGKLVRFGPDCNGVRGSVPGGHAVIGAPDADAAYVLDANSLRRTTLWAEEWSLPLDQFGGAPSRMFPTDAGDVLLADDETAGSSYVARVSAAGELVWEGTVADSVSLMQDLGAGRAAVLRSRSPAHEDRLSIIAADGSEQAEASLAPLVFRQALPRTGPGQPRLWLLAPDHAWSTQPTAIVAPQADATLQEFAPFPQGLRPSWVHGGEVLGSLQGVPVALRTNGDVAPLTATPLQRPLEVHHTGLVADHAGAAYVARIEQQPAVLHHVGADGALEWSRALDPSGDFHDASKLELWLGTAHVCSALHGGFDTAWLTCHDRADGSVVSQASFSAPAAVEAALVREDGTAVVWLRLPRCALMEGPCDPVLAYATLAPGAAAPEPVLAFTEYSRAWPMENEVLVLHGSPASLSLLDVEAEIVWSLALPSDWQVGSGYTTELAWSDDALLLAHALTDGVGVQEIERATGVVRWSRTLDAMPLNAPIAAAWLGGGWAVTHQDEATRTSRTVAIEAHDGSTRWQREDVLAAEILGPTSSGQFAVLDRTRPAADLEVRSSLDGEPVAATTVSSRLRRLPANNPADPLDAVLVGAQRALVLEVELDDPAGASTTLRAFDLAPPGTTVSAASAALAGSWYRPDTAGQGLYLDWLPDQHTVFGAWFTSSVEGGHAHSEQRWYVLQGEAQPGASVVHLSVSRAVGGAFDQGPPIAAEAVGNASLMLDGCTRAQLHYDFDAPVNEGRSDILVLQRLTPSMFPCDGAAARALSGRRGAWYDDQTAGQGLFIEPVQFDDASVAMAAFWFTFDPEGAADDPTTQHWFTLQAVQQQSAADDTFELTIHRTIGGRFDHEGTGNTQAVGLATLTFEGCASAALAYAFSATALAGPFAELSGEIALQRIGGCED